MDMAGGRIGAGAEVCRHLQHALRSLYDPMELGKSPILTMIHVQGRRDPATALRNGLIKAIEALKPADTVPAQSASWRLYHILRQRYVEQFTQSRVAANLGLSTRQLGRLERQAVMALAQRLVAEHGMPLPPIERDTTTQSLAGPNTTGATPSTEEEMAWLRASCPTEPIECAMLLAGVLSVVAPLGQALGVRFEYEPPECLPRLAVQLPSIRHALLSILTAAVSDVPNGIVRIDALYRSPQIYIEITARAGHTAGRPAASAMANALGLTTKLVHLSGGTVTVLRADERNQFAVRIALPALEQVTVLVIDDNADTLQLLERYLAGSRYRFVGSRNPLEALDLAERVRPQLVVLDLMLPGIDGWELLARFREHPVLCQARLLICTILPQEELAGLLGAATLVRKPVTQLAFLEALDQQCKLLATESS